MSCRKEHKTQFAVPSAGHQMKPKGQETNSSSAVPETQTLEAVTTLSAAVARWSGSKVARKSTHSGSLPL
jgi:hypothetical protein